ncbi:MAG: prolipoprotein diacylglyceryl transferase [Desulfocapsaceae bacterium]
MLAYPDIDPVLLQIGPLQVRWYGLMYVLGFAAVYMLVKYQLKQRSFPELQEQFENLNIALIISLIIGGRLGYVLFYNLDYYLAHPWEIPATWSGGMSFHGAAIGLVLGGLWFSRKKKIPFFKAADIYIVTIPIGLGLGRLGNFINGELFGRTTDLPWGMVFPGGGPLPRHPSQLYEAFFEGLFLFALLWSLRQRPYQKNRLWPHGSLLALFFIGYGLLRFFIEYTREPDAQLGLIGPFSMGQILCSLMIAAGLLLWNQLIRTGQRK